MAKTTRIKRLTMNIRGKTHVLWAILAIFLFSGCRARNQTIESSQHGKLVNWFDPIKSRGRVIVTLPDRDTLDIGFRRDNTASELCIDGDHGPGIRFRKAGNEQWIDLLKLHYETIRIHPPNPGKKADSANIRPKNTNFHGVAILGYTSRTLALYSQNNKKCVRIDKITEIQADTGAITITTRLKNTCAHPIIFDFASSDLAGKTGKSSYKGWINGKIIPERRIVQGEKYRTGGVIYPKRGVALMVVSGRENPPDIVEIGPESAHAIKSEAPGMNLVFKWKDVMLKSGKKWKVSIMISPVLNRQLPSRPPDTPGDLFVSYATRIPRANARHGHVLFERERVEITIKRHELAVTGHYWFKNPDISALARVGIFYPFPVSADINFPQYIDVRGIAFQKATKGIQFSVDVPKAGIREVVIRYTQHLRAGWARYIVRSALSWHRPIKKAVFLIRYPMCFSDVEVPYTPVSSGPGHIELLFHNFVPEKDIDIKWKDNCGPGI